MSFRWVLPSKDWKSKSGSNWDVAIWSRTFTLWLSLRMEGVEGKQICISCQMQMLFSVVSNVVSKSVCVLSLTKPIAPLWGLKYVMRKGDRR